MSHQTPSPEEAAAQLRAISDRQQQAAANAARKPEWMWWTMAAAMVLSGLAADLRPSLGWVPGVVVAGLALCLVLSIRSKRIAAAMGYRAAPDRQSMPRRAVHGKFQLAIAVLAVTLLMAVASTASHVPFTHTLGSVVIAALLVVVLRPAVGSLLTAVPGQR